MHTMRKILTGILFLITYQFYGQQDIKINVDDFNNNGVADTLKTYYDGGSGFGGKYVGIVNGKTNEYFEMNNYGCFCDIKHIVLIPSELNKIENKLFLQVIKNELLPERRNEPDPSLDWILKGLFSNIKLKDNPFFNLIIDPRNEWTKNKIEPPINYYIEIEGDTLKQLYSPIDEPVELSKDDKGFVIYSANNHYTSRTKDSLQLSDSNSLYKIFRTSHGVVVEKEDSHKWVFISDATLTGAPEKLRWESIKTVKLLDQHLIVQQDLPGEHTYQFFVINIETGITGRLKSDLFYSNDYSDYRDNAPIILEEAIIFNDGKNQINYNFKDIFKELKDQYIK